MNKLLTKTANAAFIVLYLLIMLNVRYFAHKNGLFVKTLLFYELIVNEHRLFYTSFKVIDFFNLII